MPSVRGTARWFLGIFSALTLLPGTVAAHHNGGATIPLNDLGSGFYLGYQGGLYPGGSNVPPALHQTDGQEAAALVAPIAGKIGVISLGLSHTYAEFCGALGTARSPCLAGTFVGRVLADGGRNPAVVFVNGSQGGALSTAWADPTHKVWTTAAQRVAAAGLTASQVQVAWVKATRLKGAGNLVLAKAVEIELAKTLRNLKAKYPNVRLVFFSSRSFGGYGTISPEPQAYENGFAVKWVIEAQITQRAFGTVDPQSGDLSYSVAPWAGWGPYVWADGTIPRSDGLVWLREDFDSGGSHMLPAGASKVGQMLHTFFTTSDFARTWFLAAVPTPTPTVTPTPVPTETPTPTPTETPTPPPTETPTPAPTDTPTPLPTDTPTPTPSDTPTPVPTDTPTPIPTDTPTPTPDPSPTPTVDPSTTPTPEGGPSAPDSGRSLVEWIAGLFRSLLELGKQAIQKLKDVLGRTT